MNSSTPLARDVPMAKAMWVRASRLAARAAAMLRLLRATGDAWPAGLALLLITGGIVPLATVYVTREVVDRLFAATAAHGEWAAVRPLLVWAAVAAAVLVASQLLQAGITWVRTVFAERLQDHITSRIHEQSTRLDLAFYESSEFFNRLHRARDEAAHRPAALIQSVSELLQGAITLCAMSLALTAFGLWLPMALFISALPVLYVVGRFGLVEQQVKRDTAADERRAWYLDEVLTSTPHAPELRLCDLGSRFREAHAHLRGKLRDERLSLARRRGLAELAAGASGVVVAGGVGVWMVGQAVVGAVTSGQLAASYQAFGQGLTTMRSLLGGVGALYANSVFLDDLFAFLSLKPSIVDPERPRSLPLTGAVGIRFRNVTFRYPDVDRAALEGFNLEIPAGQIAAIVGPNGAGKSTLIKLMSRLYDPESGVIELGGVDIRDYKVTDLRSMITVLFQEPMKYWESVADNVALGNVRTPPSRPRVRSAIAAAGAAEIAEGLPDGYDTMLGRRYGDGIELSTGEWQRIALARAFVRQCPVIALDEPTSALDPWAEADWFRRFRAAAAQRTAIIITHRLSTAMQADTIHVMKDGCIIESGSHEDLLAREGAYADSWNDHLVSASVHAARAMAV